MHAFETALVLSGSLSSLRPHDKTDECKDAQTIHDSLVNGAQHSSG